MIKKILYIALVIIALLIGYVIGFNTKHNIQYTMERTEDGISTIEIYDKSTGMCEYVNIEFRSN